MDDLEPSLEGFGCAGFVPDLIGCVVGGNDDVGWSCLDCGTLGLGVEGIVVGPS